MSTNLQCSFLHKKEEGSSGKCHLNKLLGKGKALYVATRQKESLLQGKKKVCYKAKRKLAGMAGFDFQDKLFSI